MSLSGIETAQDLMNVLDAIYNNLNTYDTYSSLKLYYNDIQRTSTIFKVKDDNTESVVAVLSLEGISTETKNYLARLIKSSIVSGTEARVYDVAVGAYIGIDQLMKNICTSLGVSLSDSFADDNPQIYSELRGIIEKYYGSVLENNTPYMLRKYTNLDNNLESYKTFIPMNIIVEFAIYLNNLGLFKTNINPITPQLLVGSSFSNNDYITIMSNKESKKFIKDYINSRWNESSLLPELLKSLDTLFDVFGSEFSDNFVKFAIIPNSSTAQIKLFEVSNNCYIKSISISSNYAGFELYISSDSDFIVKSYYVNNNSTYTRKEVNEYTSNTELNITKNKLIDLICLNSKYLTIPYCSEYFSISSSNYKRQLFSTMLTPGLVSRYDTIPFNIFKYTLSNKIYFDYINKIVNHFELNNLDNKFLVFSLGYTYDLPSEINSFNIAALFVIDRDNCKFIMSRSGSVFGLGVYITCDFYNFSESDSDLYINTYSKYLYNKSTGYPDIYNHIVVSDLVSDSLEYDVYIAGEGDYYNSITKNSNTISITNTDLGFTHLSGDSISYINLGQFIENKEPEKLNGLSLIPDSVYPKDVVDSASFSAKYPDWYTYAITNPNIVSGVVDGTNTGTWGACSISKSVKTQSDAQNALIMTDDINDIIKDTDKAIENDDEEDDPIDPEKDPDTNPNDDPDSKDKGDTPSVEDINNLPNILGAGAVKQYMLTASQLSTLMSNLNSDSIWTALSKFISNPINFIISLQAGYLYQHTGAVPNSYIKFGPYTFESCQGTLLNSNFCDINLGTVNLTPYFNNYTDITETSVSLYLPYVGYVDLDVSKFINGSIKLHARVDTLTGSIIYYVYSIRDGHEQLLNTFDGNCQLQIPVNSADYSRMYAGLFGTATAAVGGVTSIGSKVSKAFEAYPHQQAIKAIQASNFGQSYGPEPKEVKTPFVKEHIGKHPFM